MRSPTILLRAALVLGACHMAAACAINPFDGDPKGPPPAPHLWEGAYGGDDQADPYKKPTRTAETGSYRPGDSGYKNDAPPEAGGRSSYGTGDVSGGELPPPGGEGDIADADPMPAPKSARRKADPLPPPVDPMSERDEASALPPVDEEPEPSRRASRNDDEQFAGGGVRTLSTRKGGSAAPAPEAEIAAADPKPAPNKAAAGATIHKVKKGEELADIADAYDTREVDIISLNGLKPPYALKAGQDLKIPGKAKKRADAGPAKPGDFVVAGTTAMIPEPKAKPGLPGAKATVATASEEAGTAAVPARTAKADSGARFDWPVSGKVVSGFGAGSDGLYNEGINIAVSSGTPVRAAADGTVRYAGNELRGYGNLVLIEHANGYITAYAHNESLNVARGDKVKRGQVIALSGKTGNVSSPQVHFEIRKGKESVDPRKYLVAMN